MECAHPIQVAGLCALCGKEIDEESFGEQTFATLHSSASVKVSRAEAERIDQETTTRLLEQRKLALIVDLDQTIIHVTVDPTVREWAQDVKNPNWHALRDIVAFQLGADGKTVSHQPEPLRADDATSFATGGDEDGCWYFVKLRPHLAAFLATLAEKFELHVYTMGTRSYADCICRIVDPDGKLFGARILSRDENESMVQKSLARLFPINTSMVVIIDDRADVWAWSPNLIKVDPYEFFVGIGDINAGHLAPTTPLVTAPAPADAPKADAPLAESQRQTIHDQVDARPLAKLQEEKKAKSDDAPETPDAEPAAGPDAVLDDNDEELTLIESLLTQIHGHWYEAYDAKKKPDAKDIIGSMKRKVLHGCTLAFSGLIPLNETPENSAVWTAAQDFGASCRRTLTHDVTHMIAAGPGTAKAEEAYRRGDVHVVWPSWLNDSLCRWHRQEETDYKVPRSDRLASLGRDALHDLASSIHADTEPENLDEAALDDLANMDWGEAEDEVDAFLDDDDEDTESELDSASQSMLSEASDAPPARDELLRSPLSRRRHAAALRGGQSKLRQSVLAEESQESEDDTPSQGPVKRRKVQGGAQHKDIAALRTEHTATPPDSEEEHFLDDLALEMERELGDDL